MRAMAVARRGMVPACLGLLLCSASPGASARPLRSWERPPHFQHAVAVLMYHHVSPTDRSAETVSPQLLQAQLDYLKESGYHFISLEQLDAFLRGQTEVPPNAVAVTFDDGYESFYTYAAPILQRMRIPATDFVIVGRADGVSRARHLPSLTWAEMASLEKTGLFRFESHTYDLHQLVPVRRFGVIRYRPAVLVHRNPRTGRRETAETHRQRLRSDLLRARQALRQHLGGARRYLAWPYGARDRDADRVADELGFTLVFGVKPGLAARSADRHDLPRINAGSPRVSPEYLGHLLREALKPRPVPPWHRWLSAMANRVWR